VRPALKAFSITLLCACLGLLFCAPRARAQSSAPGESDDEPEANPGRPTVSTPATLTPVGYLQFETGVLGASDSPELSTQVGFGEVIKLTVAPRLQLLAAAEPIAYSTSHGIGANGVGDVFFGAQAVIFRGEGATPTVAVSYFHRAYGGDAPDLDIGSPVNSGVLLASADVKGFHYDANAMLNELTEGPVRRAQFGQTLSISHPIAGKFSLSGEIWHFTQPFLRGNAVGNLWAVGYTARRTLVLDAGFNHGLTSTSTQWEAFAGFTYLLPHRLWRK
jgi:Putative MetA-pathway of phenol degradation